MQIYNQSSSWKYSGHFAKTEYQNFNYFFLFLRADSVLSTAKKKAPVLRGFQNKYYFFFFLKFGPVPISSQTVIVLDIMTYCAHFPLRKMTDDNAYEEFQLSYMGTHP